jgi:hypothetical protein
MRTAVTHVCGSNCDDHFGVTKPVAAQCNSSDAGAPCFAGSADILESRSYPSKRCSNPEMDGSRKLQLNRLLERRNYRRYFDLSSAFCLFPSCPSPFLILRANTFLFGLDRRSVSRERIFKM